ncbi:hypothetical protein M6B38_256745 [Iris pallida]|uniref:Uncharacterized protein n=1 Tax=Iris pallida TaxID=29817 RepID=A0AAX6IFS6_IRIPA|nr:hypothetical protein M6B38_256745 [Iris pallida]
MEAEQAEKEREAHFGLIDGSWLQASDLYTAMTVTSFGVADGLLARRFDRLALVVS